MYILQEEVDKVQFFQVALRRNGIKLGGVSPTTAIIVFILKIFPPECWEIQNYLVNSVFRSTQLYMVPNLHNGIHPTQIYLSCCSHQQGGAGGEYETQGKPRLQWPWNGGIQYPVWKKQGHKQDQNLGPQEV